MRLDVPHDWRMLHVEETGRASGHCDCCATETERRWGLASVQGKAVAAYFVAHTRGKPDHGANIDLVLGSWGDGTTSADRFAVSIRHRVVDGTPEMMVADADAFGERARHLADRALKRNDIIGTPLAAAIFTVTDAVYMAPVCDEIHAWSTTRERSGERPN